MLCYSALKNKIEHQEIKPKQLLDMLTELSEKTKDNQHVAISAEDMIKECKFQQLIIKGFK